MSLRGSRGAVGELGHAAGHVIAYDARLSQAVQVPGYEKLCEAIVEAFRATQSPAVPDRCCR
jgi:hypothetical protein